MLIAVNYHYIREKFGSPYPSIFGVTPTELGDQLDLLAQKGTFVGTRQIVDAVRGEGTLPDEAWVITFDDGLREQYEFALPVLDRRDIPAIFFVNTASIENHELSTVHKIHLVRAHVSPDDLEADLRTRDFGDPGDIDLGRACQQYKYDSPVVAQLKYFLNFILSRQQRDRLVNMWFRELLGWDEAEVARDFYMDRNHLRDLANRDYLGTHGHQHVALGTLPESEQCQMVQTSLDLLEKWTGRRVQALSYPFGGKEACGPTTARVASGLGIEVAFTMERAGNADLREPCLLARCSCNDVPGGSNSRWKIDEVFQEIPSASMYSKGE